MGQAADVSRHQVNFPLIQDTDLGLIKKRCISNQIHVGTPGVCLLSKSRLGTRDRCRMGKTEITIA